MPLSHFTSLAMFTFILFSLEFHNTFGKEAYWTSVKWLGTKLFQDINIRVNLIGYSRKCFYYLNEHWNTKIICYNEPLSIIFLYSH